MNENKWSLFYEGNSNILSTTKKFIITKFLRKKMLTYYASTFLINERHGKIKRQMLNFLNIDQYLQETSSQNFSFKYQVRGHERYQHFIIMINFQNFSKIFFQHQHKQNFPNLRVKF